MVFKGDEFCRDARDSIDIGREECPPFTDSDDHRTSELCSENHIWMLTICYDERIPGQADAAVDVAAEILAYCIEAGGSLTGEHGIGADKSQYMPTMFTPEDLALMQRVRAVFDVSGLCNPGKVFPTPRMCGEVPGPYRRHPVETAGLGERM